MGAEYNKWSRRVTATHNVSLAYTRMLLGPMDYTPGGFRNATPATFRGGQLAAAGADHARPRPRRCSWCTRARSRWWPTARMSIENAAGFDFVKMVPTAWDETRFLAGDIDDYVVVARRKGRTGTSARWANEKPHEISLPLKFLGDGQVQGEGLRGRRRRRRH